MKSLSLFVFLFVTSALFSQEKIFQAEIGLNQTWFNYDMRDLDVLEAEFRPQLTVGINYNAYSFYGFNFTAGLRYHDLFRYFDMSPYGYGVGEYSTVDLYLLSVPLQIKYNVDFINTNIMLNIEPSYILKSNIKSPTISTAMKLEEREVTDEMERAQLAVGFGLEYVAAIAGENFGVKTTYNFGLTTIPKKGTITNSHGTYEWVPFKTTELNLMLTYYF